MVRRLVERAVAAVLQLHCNPWGNARDGSRMKTGQVCINFLACHVNIVLCRSQHLPNLCRMLAHVPQGIMM